MAWLHNIFGKNKSHNQQHSPNEPNKQQFTSVVQAVLEETILAVAYWLIGIVKQSLEPKPEPPAVEAPNNIEALNSPVVEELATKVIHLIDKFEQPHQAIMALDNRIDNLEKTAATEVNINHKITQLTTKIESRLAELESGRHSLDTIAEKFGEFSQTLTTLDSRIAHLEKMESGREEMNIKVGELSQNLTAIHHQIADLESLKIFQASIPEELIELSQSLNIIDTRLSHLEKSGNTVDIITDKLGEFRQTLVALESRIAYLEKILPRVLLRN